MGAGHRHGPAGPVTPRHRRRLWLAFLLLSCFLVVEGTVALVTGSLALLSDAGHMFADVLGMGMALAAMMAARRAASDPQRTYGLYRVEVLAALANAVLLSGVAVYVLVEAVRRFADPADVPAGPILAAAVGGLVVNLTAMALLRAGARENLNLRGAYLEVVGDLLGSVGVIVAASLIALAGWWWADPVVAVAIGLFILPRTFRLGRAAVRILVQAAPAHVDVPAVQARLAAVPGVSDVHDLHVWTLTSGMEVASAHLALDSGAEVGPVLDAARGALHDDFQIDHATLQVEPGASGACGPTDW